MTASNPSSSRGTPNPVAPPGSENLPGFEFLSRIGRAAGIALVAQSEAANRAWADMLNGRYTVQSATRTWAQLVENYYDVLVEFWRGPGYVARPAWVYFDYSYTAATGAGIPETLKAPAKMDRARTPETEPEPTAFASLDGKQSSDRLYKSYDWTGHDLTITLNVAEVRKLESGLYISFVFAKGRSSEAPLAIVALRVQKQD